MTSLIFILILAVHFVSDFMLQSGKMALNKSRSNYWLSVHVLFYSLPFMLLFGIIFQNAYLGVVCGFITFVTHWITDYFTSRWTTKLYKAEKRGAFFKVIGFDQLIHFTTLFLTYDLIKSL